MEKIKNYKFKDSCFGCLSSAVAVLLHNYEHLISLLNENPQISNKLACEVRDLMLIEPLYARTIKQGAIISTELLH